MNKKKILKLIKNGSIFLVVTALYFSITAPLIAFYGPFERVKYTLVGAAMTTASHQYIAKTFLSGAEIQRILDKNKAVTKVQNMENTKFNDNDNSIELEEIKGDNKFRGYMLIVHDPKRVRIGYAKEYDLKTSRVGELAAKYNALAAINGGGFSFFSAKGFGIDKEHNPMGILIKDGEIKYKDDIGDDEKIDVMGLTKDYKLLVGPHSINELKKLNINDALSFGPALVVNGEGTISSKADGGYGLAPRTAIGQRKDGTILMLVIEGREIKSLGASLKDVQDVMLKYGAYNSTNLDGGGSSKMYFKNHAIDYNSNLFDGREVPSIVYVK